MHEPISALTRWTFPPVSYVLTDRKKLGPKSAAAAGVEQQSGRQKLHRPQANSFTITTKAAAAAISRSRLTATMRTINIQKPNEKGIFHTSIARLPWTCFFLSVVSKSPWLRRTSIWLVSFLWGPLCRSTFPEMSLGRSWRSVVRPRHLSFAGN